MDRENEGAGLDCDGSVSIIGLFIGVELDRDGTQNGTWIRHDPGRMAATAWSSR